MLCPFVPRAELLEQVPASQGLKLYRGGTLPKVPQMLLEQVPASQGLKPIAVKCIDAAVELLEQVPASQGLKS